MDKLTKLLLLEGIKDRFTTWSDKDPDFSFPKESIEKGCEAMVEVLESFDTIHKEESLNKAIHYLIDTVGFYTILCIELTDTNSKLLGLLKNYNPDLDEGDL